MHAGQPECYAYGEQDQTSNITALNNLAQKYINNTYAEGAHAITYNEALAITGSVNATSNNLRKTGTNYYLASPGGTVSLYSVNNDGGFYNGFYVRSIGFRPVVVLKSTIKTTGKTVDAVGQVAWSLVSP